MNISTLRSRGFILPARLRNSYEGGSSLGSRTRNWQPSSSGPNTVAASQLATLRRRSRDAIRNDPWAKKALATHVSNVIGTGIQPFPQHPDKKISKALKDLWNDWYLEADADGRLDFYGLQALAARAIFQDGESLARLRFGGFDDDLCVPLQVQLISAAHLPEDKNEPLTDGAEIINGVEFDEDGRRVAYHLWKKHPGEMVQSAKVQELKPVHASEIIHSFPMLEPGQVRGIPELATVLLRLKSLDNFDDAVLFRQEVSNLFAGFITKPAQELGHLNHMTGEPVTNDSDGTAIVSLEPGSMNVLRSGETVNFSSPPDAGANYEGFMRQQLMAAFASVGQPYELGSGDLRGISDRVLRVIVNEFHRLIEQLQWHVFIFQFCRPVWKAWMDAVVLSGALPIYDYDINKRFYHRVRWVPQGWAYFNPVQDVQANEKQVRAGFKSRTSVKLEQGEDPDEVDDEIMRENEIADRMGFTFDSDPRQPKSGTNIPPSSIGGFFYDDEVNDESKEENDQCP